MFPNRLQVLILEMFKEIKWGAENIMIDFGIMMDAEAAT